MAHKKHRPTQRPRRSLPHHNTIIQPSINPKHLASSPASASSLGDKVKIIASQQVTQSNYVLPAISTRLQTSPLVKTTNSFRRGTIKSRKQQEAGRVYYKVSVTEEVLTQQIVSVEDVLDYVSAQELESFEHRQFRLEREQECQARRRRGKGRPPGRLRRLGPKLHQEFSVASTLSGNISEALEEFSNIIEACASRSGSFSQSIPLQVDQTAVPKEGGSRPDLSKQKIASTPTIRLQDPVAKQAIASSSAEDTSDSEADSINNSTSNSVIIKNDIDDEDSDEGGPVNAGVVRNRGRIGPLVPTSLFHAEAILQHRDKLKKGLLVREYLVKQKGRPKEDSTWEPEESLQSAEDLLKAYQAHVVGLELESELWGNSPRDKVRTGGRVEPDVDMDDADIVDESDELGRPSESTALPQRNRHREKVIWVSSEGNDADSEDEL
ncbi:MAG: hypothetical protein M1812_005788 [Candelaria pacifica]|nr:MAG: hypothetical protein M1812_005788 [Candelaria pacifica]